jgi:glycosyltransferase involved in cell wall biosynthesis
VVADAGFLVPPRNSQALTEAIGRALCLSDGERERLGVAARARVVGNFSLDAMADCYQAIYEGRCQQANLQGHD